jgi:hypothetical protein
MVVYYAATENSGGTRAFMLGPYGVAEVATSGNSFMPVTTMGYTRVRTANLAPLSNFGKIVTDLTDRANSVSDPWVPTTTEVGLGYLTESGSSGNAVQNCFIYGEVSGLII